MKRGRLPYGEKALDGVAGDVGPGDGDRVGDVQLGNLHRRTAASKPLLRAPARERGVMTVGPSIRPVIGPVGRGAFSHARHAEGAERDDASGILRIRRFVNWA